MKFAIIGCGRVSNKHVTAIKKSDEDLVATCDLVLTRAQEYTANAYTDYNTMLEENDIDIVSVCTNHFSHASIIIDVCKHENVKYIICEKPITISMEEAEAVKCAVEKAGKVLFVVKQNRYNTPIMHLKNAIVSNRMRVPYYIDARVLWSRPQSYYDQEDWRGREGDGVLMNQTSHHLDLMQWLVGKITHVSCVATTATHNIEAEDTAVAHIKFESGTIGHYFGTTCTYPKNIEGSITVLSENGTVKVGGMSANRMDIWNMSECTIDDDLIKNMNTFPDDVYGYGHTCLYNDIINYIKNGTSKYPKLNPIAFMDDGIDILLVIQKLIESSKKGGEWLEVRR